MEQIVAAVKGHTLVFVDMNDTAIDDRSGQLNCDHEFLLASLRDAEEAGLTIGLCSDSPSELMLTWGLYHGFNGPMAAEGGLVVNGKPFIDLNIAEIRSTMHDWCINNGVKISNKEVRAIEFGGSPPSQPPCVAFGFGRYCSVSLFSYDESGAGGLIDVTRRLGDHLMERYGSAVDVNLSKGIILVHHKVDFRDTKRKFLRELGVTLNAVGKRLVMIGNSRSDTVEAPELCYVMMVGNCTTEARLLSDHVVEGHFTLGVIEALGLITSGIAMRN